MTTKIANEDTRTSTTARVMSKQLPPIDISIAKDVERMKLRDGTITPEMVRYLNSREVVEALLN